MGDKYEVGQGIAGKGVHAHGNSFEQIDNRIELSVDMSELAVELRKLREAMAPKTTSAEHFLELAQIAEAEKAATDQDSTKVVKSLKAVGKWTLDATTSVGVKMAAEVIVKSAGIQSPCTFSFILFDPFRVGSSR